MREEEGKLEKKNWLRSIWAKQMLVFTTVILFTAVSFIILQFYAIQTVMNTTYEKMSGQTTYFLRSFEQEMDYIKQQQVEFFNDRRLPFLSNPWNQMNDYERRDGLLSLNEKLSGIVESSRLVKRAVLYLPQSGYRITEGAVERMEDNDFVELRRYEGCATGKIYFSDDKIFTVETGGHRVEEEAGLYALLSIEFSTEKIQEQMSVLNSSEENGVLFYNAGADFLIESCGGEPVGRKICEVLEQNGDDTYPGIQSVEVNSEQYLVSAENGERLGLFIQYTKARELLQPIYKSRVFMCLILTVLTVLSLGFVLYTRNTVHRPIRTLLTAFEEVKKGKWDRHIKHKKQDEFSDLYEGFNDMEDQLVKLVDEVYVQTNLAQRAQMKQLQAQINPHFLYNSFFVLSRRVKRHDYENAEQLARYLGNYFQYLTRNESDYVTLRQEFDHAKSYAAIQGMRFVSRLTVDFGELPENCERIQVPRLILQPLLENVFEHGLKNKVKEGILRVSVESSEGSLRIHVEDNGEETTDRELMELQEYLKTEDGGEITGIRNIHRRLQIYFNGKGGLRISRSRLGGVRITLWINLGKTEK